MTTETRVYISVKLTHRIGIPHNDAVRAYKLYTMVHASVYISYNLHIGERNNLDNDVVLWQPPILLALFSFLKYKITSYPVSDLVLALLEKSATQTK